MSNIIKGEESKEIELEKNTLENTICLNYQDGYSDVCHNEEYLDKLKDKLYTETVIPKQFFEGYRPYEYFKIYNNKVCENCGCNPKNGGSGNCNCILATPTIF